MTYLLMDVIEFPGCLMDGMEFPGWKFHYLFIRSSTHKLVVTCQLWTLTIYFVEFPKRKPKSNQSYQQQAGE